MLPLYGVGERSAPDHTFPPLHPFASCSLFGGRSFPGTIKLSRKGRGGEAEQQQQQQQGAGDPDAGGAAAAVAAVGRGVAGLSLADGGGGVRRPMVSGLWVPVCLLYACELSIPCTRPAHLPPLCLIPDRRCRRP